MSLGCSLFSFSMLPENRILIIDDDQDVLDLLDYNLSKEGYLVRCLQESSQAMEVAAEFKPTLIILDVMMPVDGFILCRQFRSQMDFQEVTIFFLTAMLENRYETEAFQSGADDFIHKMIGIRSLTNRIELVLKRHLVIKKRIKNFQVGNWEISRDGFFVSFKNKTTKLAPEEFEIFYFMAQNSNRTLTREQITQIIGGSNLFQFPVAIDKCLHSLLKKLGEGWILHKGKNGLKFNKA
jgi:two-component system alkaline phosphatase synthesis response regulator PhoP